MFPCTEYCVTNDHIYVLFVVITIQSVWYLLFFISFPVMLCQITGFVTRLTRWMSLVEQELLTRPEYLSLPRGFRVAQSVVFYLVCFSRRVTFKAVNVSCQLSWINWFAIVYEQCFIFLWYWWGLFSWGYKWYTYNNSARFSATDCNF